MAKPKKKILLQKFLAEEQEKNEREKIAQDLGSSEENIVIHKVGTAGKIIEKLVDIFFAVGKVVIIVLIIGILSIGATVLINSDLRTDVLGKIIESFN